MDQAQLIGIYLGVGALALLALVIFVKANIVICAPNEVVIISGRKRKTKDGAVVGYRLIRGGRGFKWPLLESARRLPLTTRTVEVRPHKALCQGMIPVDIEGRANVKLAGREEDGLEAGIERFLGKGVEAIDKTAQQVLEGALRGVIAGVRPEEANERRLELAQEVAQRARAELSDLGIVLDFFQIQDLSDGAGYLEAIGRRRNAEVQRDAQIAEAEADAEARQVSAEQRRIGREAEIAAEQLVIQKENALEVERANLAALENEARERASVAGHIARVDREVELESRRAELSEKKHAADTVIPAKARSEADRLKAEGRAARIREEGRATAEAVRVMREEWDGGAAQELFMIRMFPELVDNVTRVVAENLRVDKLTILDGGGDSGGDGLPNYVRNLTGSAVAMMEQMKNATGVDLARIAERSGEGQSRADVPGELD
jgi:flotillin